MKKFALLGNPNCGKTTLFNSLTGATAQVGNWPGVTVEKKEGIYKAGSTEIALVDLPGIYSLSPYTPEEIIARDFILNEKPDCVINIIDATNLTRNLYLTTELLEIDVPVVIALNMIDALEKNGDQIDEKILEQQLGVPVVRLSALRQVGCQELMTRALAVSSTNRPGKSILEHTNLAPLLQQTKQQLVTQKIAYPLYQAIKLLESHATPESPIKTTLPTTANTGDLETQIAGERYQFITQFLSPALTRQNAHRGQLTKSERIDKVLTHKVWSIPIFLFILFGLFHLTFGEDLFYLGAIFHLPSLQELGLLQADGAPINFWVKLLACFYDGAIFSPGVVLSNFWNEIAIGGLFGLLQNLVAHSGMASWAIGLVNNGILDGVSAVLSFLPWILTLFLFFSILEDSGYMARVAFILDKPLRKFGLSGRALLPMIMGFGCSVPAMVNTRTLADDRERTATIRVIPFFLCGAKLPILTALGGGIVAYFGVGNADLITYGMYLLGILTAMFSVLILRATSLRGATPPFIMELPTYHLPLWKNLMLHLWDKIKHFVTKAFTVIATSTIIIWVLSHFDFSWHYLADTAVDQSILAGFGQLLQPLFTPLGFGRQLGKFGWVFVVAVITGLIAKENVVATLSTLAVCLTTVTSLDFGGLDLFAENGIGAVQAIILATGISIPGLLAFIAFNLTTIPCMAAVATARSELGPTKKFKGTIFFWLLTSFTIGTLIYTVGTWWWTLFIWLGLGSIIALFLFYHHKHLRRRLV